MSTSTGFVIRSGEAIPDNVVEVTDHGDDIWTLTPRGHWHLGEAGKRRCQDGRCVGGGDPTAFAPLTVTAVREPDPICDAATCKKPGHHHDDVPTFHVDEIFPPEPEPSAESVPDVLDLVRRFGGACVVSGKNPMEAKPADEAEALFARIEAEVQRLRDERDGYVARLKATDASWAKVAAERDDARQARDFLAERVVKPAREALDAVGINGGVKIADRILMLANERDEARGQARTMAAAAERFQAAIRAREEEAERLEAGQSDPRVLSLPQQPGASGLLDLIEKYTQAVLSFEMAEPRSTEERKAEAEARALFDRIAALIPQQPVQARDANGMLWWIHGCGEVNGWVEGDQPGPDHCGAAEPGSWRPLLVAPAPPREPRTWKAIDGTEDLPALVDVSGHGRWKRNRGTDVYVHTTEERGFYSHADLRELGNVTEVFDDEAGTR